MINVQCSLCGEKNNFKVIYPQNFKENSFTPEIFSARRIPDNIHYQIVKCSRCGLVRSNPILEQEKIFKLYEKSHFKYLEEINNIRETYGKYLLKLDTFRVNKNRLLENGVSP